MGLRDEHRELTRRKVLDAVLELVAEGSLDDLSVPAVARRSGVSLATIYRYFPTRDGLLAAAAEEPARRALAADRLRRDAHAERAEPADDDDLAELGAYQRAVWRELADNLPLLRHQLASRAGREMRRARLDRSRGQLAAYLEGQGIDPTSAEGARLISLLLLVSGSLALVELHDRQGLGVDEALDVSRWAAGALIAASRPAAARPSRTTTTTPPPNGATS